MRDFDWEALGIWLITGGLGLAAGIFVAVNTGLVAFFGIGALAAIGWGAVVWMAK